MTINLEQIDEIKKRLNVGFEEAKEALEKSNGDILEALVYLEKNNKVKPEQKTFYLKTKELLKKGCDTRFVILKKDRVVYDFSVLVTGIITVLATYIVVPGLLLAVFFGYKFKLKSKEGDNLQVNKTLAKISDAVSTAKKKLVEDDTVEIVNEKQ